MAGKVLTHYLPTQLQPLRSRIGGADAESGKASRSMFNKVRLPTIDYATGRALQLLSMQLAALKTLFPETCEVSTEILLSRTPPPASRLRLPGLCCPILDLGLIAPQNHICRRVAQLCRGRCCLTCGVWATSKSVIPPHRLARQAPVDPLPGK